MGASWFCCLAAILEFPNIFIPFKFKKRNISIHAKDRGIIIPVVLHARLQKSIKSNLFSYLIFAQESKSNALSIEEKD